jgi:tetratricopeptide (TPR) repeat protein
MASRQMLSTLRQSFFAVLCCVSLAKAPLAIAQSDPDKIAKATAAFDEAETYYNLRKWDKALEKYEEAYVLSKEPALLFNIGQCYRQMGRYDDAIGSYRTFLRLVSEDNPARSKAEELIKSTEELKASGVKIEPTSIPQPENPTSEPAHNTKAGPGKAILFGGIGGIAVSGVFGGIAIKRAIDAHDIFEGGQAQAGNELFKSAQKIGYVSDSFLFVGLGAVVAGFVLQSKEKKVSVSLSPLYKASNVTISVGF